jgi:hypothetical protein
VNLVVRFGPAVVVLLGLGAVGGAAVAVKPAPTAAAVQATRQVAITSGVRACPPGTNGGQDRLAIFASPSDAASGGATLSALPQAGARAAVAHPATVTTAGALSLLPVPATSSVSRQQAWSVTAAGAMAQGLEAEVGGSNGLAYAECAAPASGTWFVAPGQQNGAGQIQLYLMNVDTLAATVDVSVITDSGPVQASGLTGITVPPNALVTQSLSSLAGGASVLAVDVRTSAGRVAAAVSESSGHGTPSWVPAAAAPATSLVIPGVPPSGANSGLLLVVPGSVNARVNVAALTTEGRYQPFGSQPIDLPAGSATYVQLTPLGGDAAGLQITANAPVTAAVVVPGTGMAAFTAAAQPIAEQAVIAGSTTSGGLAASIVLTAPAGTARVRLTEIAEGAVGTSPAAASGEQITVQAGRTVNVSVPTPPGAKRGTPFAVILTPLAGSGPVYAARLETQGQDTVVSVIPAQSAPTTITLPPVHDSYTAVSP